MANHIEYGIDLGTTNSAICRIGDDGRPEIIKIGVTDNIMPSSVYINAKGHVSVGHKAFRQILSARKSALAKDDPTVALQCYQEFKRDMGTDRQFPRLGGEPFTAEGLSAEVLKALRSYADVPEGKSVVITVPAKFTANQKTATLEAAKLAGFGHTELVQEPVAAAMAFGMGRHGVDGHWLVFDLGGGTFDVALMHSQDGVIEIVDTDGDTHLGGKDMDYAIVDEIFIPHLEDEYEIENIIDNDTRMQMLRLALKGVAEDVKNALTYNNIETAETELGELGQDEAEDDIDLYVEVTRDMLEEAIKPVIRRTITITQRLLDRNKINNLERVILVGGPTHIPLLRSMLRSALGTVVDTSVDPMTAVAQGAAIYASTIRVEEDMPSAQPTLFPRVRLSVDVEGMTVEAMAYGTIKTWKDDEQVWVEVHRGDGGWTSHLLSVDCKGKYLELPLIKGVVNTFTLIGRDNDGNDVCLYPDTFRVVQGTEMGAALLPYDISLGIYDPDRDQTVMRGIYGLERNNELPSRGDATGLRSYVTLHPGRPEEILRIPLYQGDNDSQGRPVTFYNYLGCIEITGDDVPVVLSTGTPVAVHIDVDRNEQMQVNVNFLSENFTLTRTIDTGVKQSVIEARTFVLDELHRAYHQLTDLSGWGEDTAPIQKALREVEHIANIEHEYEAARVRLREILADIDRIDQATAWPRLEQQLQRQLRTLQQSVEELDDTRARPEVERLAYQFKKISTYRNVPQGRSLLRSLRWLDNRVRWRERLAQEVREYNTYFDAYRWDDRPRARQLIDDALTMIKEDNPEHESLLNKLITLRNLIPDAPMRHTDSGLVL